MLSFTQREKEAEWYFCANWFKKTSCFTRFKHFMHAEGYICF